MLLLLSVCSVLATLAIGQEVTVNITQGTVVGTAAADGDYFEFHGIPYADSTSGINRFKAPLPPPFFEAPFVANRKDIKCVRALGIGYEGTEDCLVANIFTPTTDNTKTLPVMVWIKGKEFDKVYEQELSFRNFVEKEVIVVSLNYRESVLGFLCLGTETAPGNAGLKDIIAGLKWVQTNIAQFGGNPQDITLFGHGSGAAAVDLVTMSPMGQGLVQKAIAQSGSAIAPWAVSRDNLEYALQVAEALGHEITTIQQLSDVFTRTNVAALMGIINELDLTDNSLAFAPCVERKELEGVEPFMIKTPSEIIRDGEFMRIPFIFGFVDNEGTIRSEEAFEDDWLDRMDKTFTDFIQPDLKFDTDSEQSEVAQRIRTFYFGEDSIDSTSIDEYLEYHGDTMMLVSCIREARDRVFVSTSEIYLYQFSYKGVLGEPFVGPLDVETAAHSEELAYMFYSTPPMDATIRDLTIGDILVERWTNFAKTGNPTSETSRVDWLPYSRVNANYLRVLDYTEANGATLEVALRNPHGSTITFWEPIYDSHFLDARSSWEIIDRNEDDDDGEGGEGDNGNGDGGDGDGGNGDGGDGDDGNGDGGDGDDGNGDGGDGDGGNEDGGDGDDGNGDGGDGDGGNGDGGDGDGGNGDDGDGDDGNGDGGNEDDGNGDGGDGDDENGDGGDGDDGNGDGGGGDGGNGNGGNPGSVSAAVGYTFLIVCLFSILSQFHSSQILS